MNVFAQSAGGTAEFFRREFTVHIPDMDVAPAAVMLADMPSMAERQWQFLNAIRADNLPLARSILLAGVEINFHYPVQIPSPLHEMIRIRNAQTASLVRADYRTGLHFVQSEAMARLLIEYGADVNLRDAGDLTPLMHIVMHGIFDEAPWSTHELPHLREGEAARIAQVFIDAGAGVNPSAPSYDNATLLQLIISHSTTRHWPMFLLNQPHFDGIDRVNDLSQTALHVAADRGHGDFVQWLLAAGADPTLRDGEGRTAYEIALRAHSNTDLEAYGQIASALKEAGSPKESWGSMFSRFGFYNY